MTVELQVGTFSGPLDLLLQLLGEKKLNISELALSDVTEQYLLYLDQLEENRAEELADFLVIGSKLLLLKSRQLLPQFAVGEEDEMSGLEEQLRLYKQFVEASKTIDRYWQDSRRSVFRFEPPRRPAHFVDPSNLDSNALRQSMIQLLNRLQPPKPLPKSTIDRTISMKEKIDFIRQLLRTRKHCTFREVLQHAGNRTELIVSFLAMLELVKVKAIALKQQRPFGDIVIQRV